MQHGLFKVTKPGGQFWTPITPPRGLIFHADQQARDRAELVTDDRAALREQLEAATGERIAALEAVDPEKTQAREAGRDPGRGVDRENRAPETRNHEPTPAPDVEKAREP